MLTPPLQLIDSFLLNYNLGDVLLLAFVAGAVAILPKRSLRLLSVHTIAIGLGLIIVPTSAMEPSSGSVLGSAFQYTLFGIVLVVVAPVLYTVSRR